MDISQAVQSRRSIRAFTDTPVPLETLSRVLDQARWAPSGCNFQPWEATVLTGQPLHALQEVLLASDFDDPQEYDYVAPERVDRYLARRQELGSAMYGALGIAREDRQARAAEIRINCQSFGAPVLLLAHFPKLMKEAQWADVGMWLQTVMLLLRGEGLDSCAQGYIGYYRRTIQQHLNLPQDHVVAFGLAIGQRDERAPVNTFERKRVPLAEQVSFQGF